MIKTISIGDCHGSALWKMIKPDEYDKIIFVGDYVDSFTHSDTEILHNLKGIIEMKKRYMDKVVLLLGNHDIMYMFSYSKYGCSGYRPSMYTVLHQLFNDNKDLFVPSYGIEADDMEYVWTHAGIHRGWYDDHLMPWVRSKGRLKDEPLDVRLQAAFNAQAYPLFQVGHLRGGYEDMGGIFWLDLRLLADKPKKRMHQIVGHTKVNEIKTIDLDVFTSVTCIDCLESDNPLFYELNIYNSLEDE